MANEDRRALAALEVAAALGQEVEAGLWRVACQRLRLKPPVELVQRMLEHSLVRPAEGGWAFAQTGLRQHLLDGAGRAGRLQAIHKLCATALRQQHPHPDAAQAMRIAGHELDADRPADALAPLLYAAAWHRQHGNLERATEVLEIRHQALKTLQTPSSDPAWGDNWLQEILIHFERDQLDQAHDLIERFLYEAHLESWESRSEGYFQQGRLAVKRDQLPQARKAFKTAMLMATSREQNAMMARIQDAIDALPPDTND